MQTKDGILQWHPAFYASLHVELEKIMDCFDIQTEYAISKKPMIMDILVIKKELDFPVEKNIAHIFRKHNIIEYKSPEDYLSINDFYKVYGYACFYQADTEKVCEIDPEEITITFVCSHYPRKFIEHLRQVRKLSAREYCPGIYYIEGDPFPIQVIVVNQLSPKENYWLHNLRNDLKPGGEIQELIEKYEEKKHSHYYQAVMDLIIRANWEAVKEEKKMCDALRELFAEELKESEERGMRLGIQEGMQSGLQTGMQQGLQTGEIRGIKLAKAIFRLAEEGRSVTDIAAQCEISEERVIEILE